MQFVFAVIKFALLGGLIALTLIFQPFILLVTKGRFSYVLPQFWHWCACRILNITVELRGDVYRQGQVIFMSNHVSYLDIPVLGSLLRGAFVAKEDVAGWALFGLLSRLQQTIFISRARGAAAEVQKKLDSRLMDGQDLIIFPEGTSTDGRDVYPFKSSLFSLIVGSQAHDLAVQPISLQVVETDGRLVERTSPQELLDLYAWHIHMDTELGVHLWRFACLKGARLVLTFHAPLLAKDYTDRKLMAQACYEQVKGGLA